MDVRAGEGWLAGWPARRADMPCLPWWWVVDGHGWAWMGGWPGQGPPGGASSITSDQGPARSTGKMVCVSQRPAHSMTRTALHRATPAPVPHSVRLPTSVRTSKVGRRVADGTRVGLHARCRASTENRIRGTGTAAVQQQPVCLVGGCSVAERTRAEVCVCPPACRSACLPVCLAWRAWRTSVRRRVVFLASVVSPRFATPARHAPRSRSCLLMRTCRRPVPWEAAMEVNDGQTIPRARHPPARGSAAGEHGALSTSHGGLHSSLFSDVAARQARQSTHPHVRTPPPAAIRASCLTYPSMDAGHWAAPAATPVPAVPAC